MNIKKSPSYLLTESEVTDESVYRQRRQLLKQLGFLGAGSLLSSPARAGIFDFFDKKTTASFKQFPLTYQTDDNAQLPLTPEAKVTSHNNFYEFGAQKHQPAELAQNFDVSNWRLTITGDVEQQVTLSLDDFYQKFPLEERIYRLRCVEAWSMIIPWIGFPLHKLLALAKPLAKAKYVAFETLYDPEQMPGQASRLLGGGIDYPYVEGLRIDEAVHPLTLMAVGLYGKNLPAQNGAPIRLVLPWKYGFKSIKSLVKIRLMEKQPPTTWNLLQPNEYGFYANVNPEVDHPRWSQASERLITTGGLLAQNRVATLPFNGYAEAVADLYRGMDLARFY